MIISTYYLAIFSILLLIAILQLTYGIKMRKKFEEMQMERDNVQREHNQNLKRLTKLQGIEKQLSAFKDELKKADTVTHLQKPRIKAQHSPEMLTIPDRYKYVHPLSHKGISSSDIASILTISSQEAKQLVTLANLAQ